MILDVDRVSGENKDREYVTEALLDHGRVRDGELLFKVHWKGYPRANATWEPTGALPCGKVVRY